MPGITGMSESDAHHHWLDAQDSPPEGDVLSASEVRLVHSARSGDQDAFRELVQRYERRVFRVVNRFITDPDTVADLLQEIFLRAWERLAQFDTSRRFGPWLFRMAINLTYDHLRRVRRRIRWSLFSDSSRDHVPDPEVRDPRVELDLSQEVQLVLAEVPEAYRTVLILRDLEGFCTADVAAVTDRSEATIRWRLAEARRMFREAWERRERRGRQDDSDPSAENTG
ncbi:MAG: Sigma-24 [Planctomycetota bacterium]|jgi:RNA polymerase sigma-70 factor (ECF subfamily)